MLCITGHHSLVVNRPYSCRNTGSHLASHPDDTGQTGGHGRIAAPHCHLEINQSVLYGPGFVRVSLVQNHRTVKARGSIKLPRYHRGRSFWYRTLLGTVLSPSLWCTAWCPALPNDSHEVLSNPYYQPTVLPSELHQHRHMLPPPFAALVHKATVSYLPRIFPVFRHPHHSNRHDPCVRQRRLVGS